MCHRHGTDDKPGTADTAFWLERRVRELGFEPGEAVSALAVHDDLLQIDARLDEIEAAVDEEYQSEDQ